MNQEELRTRTKIFALRIIKLATALPKRMEADIIGRQILKSGTSVGANYREATRARSKADFISKIGIVEQEIDETLYWLELLAESKIIDPIKIEDLIVETKELLAIFVSSGKTAKER
ncbi:four helix bundle protein [bacterium]|nr:four helix bundle protein [bacterium]MBU1599866.1 four helix bundle protein [bacterium]MBU2461888.1 four helix bundle protein [bacterium]